MMMTLKRELDLDKLVLATGSHSPDHTYCVMEAVAFVAGEEWSDHPKCTSPVLGAFLRSFNDGLDDSDRQKLKEFIPRLVGTVDKEADERRAWMATDWLVRVCAPAFLDLAGLHKDAAAMRNLPALTSAAIATSSQDTIDKARTASAAAARGVAWGAASAAAAWGAAASAAAASAAAWGAAWGAAAWKKLKPTKDTLNKSALRLIEKMIEA